MKLSEFNQLSDDAARDVVLHWCHCTRWAQQLVEARPYASVSALTQQAETVWAHMEEPDLLEAYAAHPVIGDVELLRQKYADTARAEQGQVLYADDTVIEALAAGNLAYHERFGFIFIVFASGKSAQEMLQLLNARLPNTRAQELANAAQEQRKIMLTRLLTQMHD